LEQITRQLADATFRPGLINGEVAKKMAFTWSKSTKQLEEQP
jgi:hypothetical protein